MNTLKQFLQTPPGKRGGDPERRHPPINVKMKPAGQRINMECVGRRLKGWRLRFKRCTPTLLRKSPKAVSPLRANALRFATAVHGAVFAIALGLLLAFATTARAQEVSAQGNAPPMSIDEAVRKALQKNFAIEVARFSEPIAAANVLAALGAFDPCLNVDFSAAHHEAGSWSDPITGTPPPGLVEKSDRYGASLGGLLPWGMEYSLTGASENLRKTSGGFASDYGTSAGITLRQPLLRGFGLNGAFSPVRIAQTDRAISSWEFQAVVIDTVTQVVQTCNELHYAQARLRSARRSRELAQQVYSENQLRFERNAISEFDVLSAKSGVANRESDILEAERLVRDTQNRLRAMISDDHTPALLGTPLQLAPPQPPLVVRVDAAADFPRALVLRPDYQNALLSVKRGEISLRYERNQRLPNLDFVGGYGLSGAGGDFGASRRQISERAYPNYSAGVVLNVPLTFATGRGRVRGARLGLQQAEAYVHSLEQAIVVAVGNAADQVTTAWKRVEAAAAARELSTQTLDGELKRLRTGTGTTYFVLRQQEILSADEVREARARADYCNALAEYDRQIGRTLERFNVIIENKPIPNAGP